MHRSAGETFESINHNFQSNSMVRIAFSGQTRRWNHKNMPEMHRQNKWLFRVPWIVRSEEPLFLIAKNTSFNGEIQWRHSYRCSCCCWCYAQIEYTVRDFVRFGWWVQGERRPMGESPPHSSRTSHLYIIDIRLWIGRRNDRLTIAGNAVQGWAANNSDSQSAQRTNRYECTVEVHARSLQRAFQQRRCNDLSCEQLPPKRCDRYIHMPFVQENVRHQRLNDITHECPTQPSRLFRVPILVVLARFLSQKCAEETHEIRSRTEKSVCQ